MAPAGRGGTSMGAPYLRPGVPGQVPLPLTSMLGRDAAITGGSALPGRGEVRLLSLTGPGEVGKPRLAMAVANAGAERLAFVALASVRDSTLVAPTVAQAPLAAESGACRHGG